MQKLNLIQVLLLPAFLFFLPTKVAAQAWLPERSSREGPGILLGESLVLHPGLGVEGGYDSNALRLSENEAGAGRLRITPYVDLATRSKKRRIEDDGALGVTPPKLDFRLGLATYYDMYFSDNAAVDDQDNFGVDTHFHFVLFPQGVFSLLLDGSYIRSLIPYESGEEHWSWHQIRPGAGIRFSPGGGTLSFELGYRMMLLLYEDDFLAEPNNKHVHDTRLVTSWRILPKTALISKINFSPTIYMNEPESAPDAAINIAPNVDSLPIRAHMGLQGLLTPRFGLSLFAGYGASFYDTGDDFDGFLAHGELMFFILPTANIRLGGRRDFVDSFYSNFYTITGGYLKYEQMFGGIVLATLKGDVYYREYSTVSTTTPDVTTPPAERNELWIGATLLIEARATDWLSFFASGVFQANVSDYENVFQVPTADPDDDPDLTEQLGVPVEFLKFEAMGGVRVHY
ncbi:MAG: hypothetical protein QNJ97_02200 [Myxococcota bacterium]|nr:hypothetical protein [Myxococcota bacterium]